MAALPPIDDSNTFPDKTEGGDPGTATDVVSAADLNALKTVISENRAQANAALTAASGGPHASTHASGGSDPVSPASIGAMAVGAAPTAHAASHAAGGTDPVSPASIGAIAGLHAATLAGNLTEFAGTMGDAVADSGVSSIQVQSTVSGFANHVYLVNPHAVTAAQVGADPKMAITAEHTTATRVLTDADHNRHQRLNTASNAIAVSIPNTLTVPFSWTARMPSGANPVTFAAGAGLITPEFIGQNTATDAGTWLHVFVESSTYASVAVAEKVP